jgi:hypothetical protein
MLLGAALLGGDATGRAGTAELDHTATFNLIEENDSFLPSDRHYTQGLKLSFASGEQETAGPIGHALDALARTILLPVDGAGRQRYGLFFGQSLFSPENLLLDNPDPTDRPYAGWLYGGANLTRETDRTLDRAEVTIGLVGPGAGGEYVQNNWHHYTYPAFHAPHANGWNTQLRNEPGLVLSEQRIWRLPGTAGPFEVDLLPEVNAALGNVFTYGAAGGMVRFGQHLRADWGPPRVQPALGGADFVNASERGALAWYLFAGGEARLVGRNIFLDGNSFKSSRSVDKEPLVADLTAGAAVLVQGARVAVSYTRRTDEFTTQRGDDEFLSITLSVTW